MKVVKNIIEPAFVTMAVVLMTLMVFAVIGCDEGIQMAGDVIGGPGKTPDPVMNGQMKKPDPNDSAPVEVIEFGYYADEEFTEPLVDSVLTGATIYTKIVFSKAVPIVVADDKSARPKIFYTAGGFLTAEERARAETQYRIKPRDAVLQNGEAKLYRDTDDTIICKGRAVRLRIGLTTIFRTRVGNRAFSDYNLVIITRPTSSFFPPEGQEYPAPEGEPGDLIGQVCAPTSNRRIEYARPIPGATVTIASGPRTGEQVTTDRGGYYLFSNVEGDELHVLVEREYFEPKEAIVHRSRPTTLPDRVPIHYREDAQNIPGTILIGARWPDEVRFILEEVFLSHDLLHVNNETGRSAHSPGLIKVVGKRFTTGTHSHELAHAHQYALALLYGYKDTPDWINTPEGKAYIAAMNKDLEEGNTISLDPSPTHGVSVPFENAAVICARYWTVDAIAIGGGYKGIEVEAPNRFRWAQVWLNKKYD
ncbi:hypothetical protein C6501_18020 [Candidatus Poribacteria bacterium]|nr:MAG: hypothetical protein C6501_18020 [Candidatus Poribacteria bacterium]